MSEHERAIPAMPEFESIELRFGDRIVTLTTEDTMIRQFTQGDGAFDHCVHVIDRRVIAFTPTEEAMTKMIVRGFRVRHDEAIDDATREHYAKVQAAGIDDDRYMLGI